MWLSGKSPEHLSIFARKRERICRLSVSLNSRLDSNEEEEEGEGIDLRREERRVHVRECRK